MLLLCCNIYNVFIFIMVMSYYSTTGHLTLHFNNEYENKYGIDWIYFPDGTGNVFAVDLISKLISEKPAPNDIELQFRRYRRNIDDYVTLDFRGNVLTKNVQTNDLFKNSIKIITHGWRSSVKSPSVEAIKDAYLEVQDVDVITVDWNSTANSIIYYWVADATETVGEVIAGFLDGLNKQYNVKGSQIHLIGHSLGAHVMGVAASKSVLNIGRITGLDPARPLFEFPSRHYEGKLDSNDANFVDVIHTCSGILGAAAALGTVDFYPNGGVAPQPGCESIQKIMESCSHRMAPQYFAMSIRRPDVFPAYNCSSWRHYWQGRCGRKVFMGEKVNSKATGIYFLTTEKSLKQRLERQDIEFGGNVNNCVFG